MKRVIAPRLDDRTFAQLRAEAIERIQAACPEWTDFSPSDPGIALAEVFAYLTQTLLYRLNRVPDKQYRAFLGLLGVTELPPSAATTALVFSRTGKNGAIEIPRGTRVAADTVVFSTMHPVRLEADQAGVECQAFHGTLIEGELLGTGTGGAGLEFTVAHPPIVAPMDDRLDLVVAVEETDPIPPEARAVQFGHKTFRVWREVANFAELSPGERAFQVDRRHGIIRFPPTADIVDQRGQVGFGGGALGAIVPQGREIRASYRTGGGASGNLRAGVLVGLKDRIAGVTVTNPVPAAGGRDAESLDNLLVRGPTDFHRLERAVTARDYETLARRTGGIARAKAFTKSEVWRHAPPGVVQALIVPTMSGSEPHRLDDFREQQVAGQLAKVQAALDDARQVATRCEVEWTRLKPVSVKLRAVVSRQEDRIAVQKRILDRLHRLITPLPRSAWDEGWAHGRSLRRYDLEGTVRAEPGVLYVTDVELTADLMPADDVASVAVDAHQPRTWFAGGGQALYRSTNAGDGWELVKELPAGPDPAKETVLMVRTSPFHPGHVAIISQVGDGDGRRTYLSRDCGETWEGVGYSDAPARDAAWADRDGTPLLFFATDGGLYEFLLDGRASPVLVEVDPGKLNRGLTSVVVHTDVRGITYVAVASNDRTGVFLSRKGGASKSFVSIGLTQSIIELAIQRDNVRAFLWAGFADPDAGAGRYELDAEPAKDGWITFAEGWGDSGSCLAFGFTRGGQVVAGSHSHGVLWLDPKPDAAWQRPSIDCGLRLRDETVLEEKRLLFPVSSLGVDASTSNPDQDRIVAGTPRGVFRAAAPRKRYEAVTDRTHFSPALREVVTLPATWLFCSGNHEVTVVAEDEAGGE